MNRFNHNNYYIDNDTNTMLKLGNKITINSGSNSTTWYVAGFDVEHNQTAADNTVYDNGYGIALIPTGSITTSAWNSSGDISGGYIQSTLHVTTIPSCMSTYLSIVSDGNHLINRNVLLSSAIGDGSSKYTYAYTWTTSYGTAMSHGQIDGTFGKSYTKYDDGEANYYLPLFKNNPSTGWNWTSKSFLWNTWLRNASDTYTKWAFEYKRGKNVKYCTDEDGVSPLIYIR